MNGQIERRIMKILIVLFISAFYLETVQANQCGEFIYNKKGWLRKYEYMNLTITENTQKHGSSSSSSGLSTESSTAASDFGVWAGHISSYAQVISTKGPCSLGTLFSYDARKKYINQNIAEVKKEFSRGNGEHLETVAFFSQCSQKSVEHFGKVVKQSMNEFSSLKEADAEIFSERVDLLIKNDAILAKECDSTIARG
jgi:hypothetical protein